MLERLDGSNFHVLENIQDKSSKKLFKDLLKSLKIELDENKEEKILKYASLTMEYNKGVNVTGAKNETDFLQYHIIDSLLGFNFFKNSKKVLDIGSGGGLPSIPLSILYEDITFTLCESKKKKASFLEYVIKELGIKNAEVRCINVYEIKDKYDVITSRAFSDLKTLVKIFGKVKTKSGKLIAYKGRKEKIEEEIEELNSKKNLRIEIIPLEYDFLNAQRHIAVIK